MKVIIVRRVTNSGPQRQIGGVSTAALESVRNTHRATSYRIAFPGPASSIEDRTDGEKGSGEGQ
jgi:hypothetical protein